ncbi:MAG: hypothetical protein WB947_02030 [Thermoplasmata archaeon]
MSAPSGPSSAAPSASAAAGRVAPRATPSPGQYRLPSWGWRILGGGLRLIPLVLLLIGVPVAILTFLQSHGISPILSIATVELFGAVITALIVARYIMKPTVLYGPLAIATAAASLAYLYILLVHSTYVLTIPSADVSIGVTFRDLILLLMIVPALTLGAGVLTTIEDVNRPRERFPFDFPP